MSAATGMGVAGSGRKLEPQVRTESTETIEGPNGIGSIETVSISVNGIPSMGAGGAVLAQRGVTQGELLRQEQRAGVVPLSQLARHGQTVQQQLAAASGSEAGPSSSAAPDEDAAMGGSGAYDDHEEDEEVPHARGPEEIGAADTGPQPATASHVFVAADGTVEMRGINVEAAVGRQRLQSSKPQQHQRPEESSSSSSSPETSRVPRSPKREAADELPLAASKKRAREDEEGSHEGISGAGRKDKADGEADEPKRDAEGDVVISEALSVAAAGDDARELQGEGAEEASGRENPTKGADGDDGGGGSDVSPSTPATDGDGDKKMTGAENEDDNDNNTKTPGGAETSMETEETS